MVKASENAVLFTGDSTVQLSVDLPVTCIKAAIADHLVMLFGDMLDEALYEFHDRERFLHIFVIFMAVVIESDRITVTAVNTGSGNHGISQIATDVFRDCSGVAFVWLGIHIETLLVLPVAEYHCFLKGRAYSDLHLMEQGGAQVGVAEMADTTPEAVVAVAAFRDETTDMGAPFQGLPKGMDEHNKTRDMAQDFPSVNYFLGTFSKTLDMPAEEFFVEG